MTEEELNDAVLLVFANKQDLPKALSPSEITTRLELHKLPKTRQWYVQGCTGTSGDGLYEGLDWLSKTISSKTTKK